MSWRKPTAWLINGRHLYQSAGWDWLGWVTFGVDFILFLVVISKLNDLLAHCRNTFVSVLAALAAIGLAFWAMRATGILDSNTLQVMIPFLSDDAAPVSSFRMAELGLSAAIVAGIGLFGSKDTPYCETCRAPMACNSESMEVSPYAVLHCLREGHLPLGLTEIRKLVDPRMYASYPGMKDVCVQAYECESCGDGMVNAKVFLARTSPKDSPPPVMFYSEKWAAAEIKQRHRKTSL